jgi:3-oxo-5alpha-steroid 4-dehydrogenase
MPRWAAASTVSPDCGESEDEVHVRNEDVFPVPAGQVGHWDVTGDVVVIGGGCAGVSAALESVRAGAETVLLESTGGLGGASASAGGEIYLGGGTPIQSACGFKDTPEEMTKFLIAALGPGADEERITAYSEGSVEHFHWLSEQGVPFKAGLWEQPAWVPPTDDGLMWMGENTYPYYELAVPAPRGHRPQSLGHGGWLLMDRLGARVAESAAQVIEGTRADRLVVDDERRVVGVIARHLGGPFTVRARRGVVVCAGGFVFNDAMLAEHAPQLLGHRKVGTEGDDGRGIRMAQAIGAQVRRMNAAQASLTVPIQLLARSLLVNRHGQRFINEDTYGGLVGLAALDGHHAPVYMVMDDTGYEQVPEKERLGRTPTWVSDSIAELEQQVGLPDGALQSSVESYNKHAERGADPQFHKRAEFTRPLRPPFGIIDVCTSQILPGADGGTVTNTGFGVFTTGGLATTTSGEVLDLNGDPITGLYAAGRTAAGIQAGGYISGTSLGDGTFFGRRAGRAAAVNLTGARG